jgi:putative peptidoglycan lipid II flippase
MATVPPQALPARRGLSLSTAASYVAIGTGFSRLTGVLRIVALAWALGQSHLADAFNLANTTPNMLYDIVLGGVLSATFIPVFVDQLANRTKEQAFTSISAVLSVSMVVLVTTTVAALVLAPAFITALTALDTSAHSQLLHTIVAERADATTLLRWFVIQIAAYGFFALATALLNTRRRFVAVAWAPIVNNLVCIGVLVWFGLLTGRGATLASLENHHSEVVLLGLGTSLGVVLQCLALIPSLRAASLGSIRWHWDLHDAALRTVVRLSGWTFGFVVANQVAQFVVILLAGTAGGADPVSSYTYAYAFLQMPYGIVAVTIMSVVGRTWLSGGPPGSAPPSWPASREGCAPCWRSSSPPPLACCSWPNPLWPSSSGTGTARRRRHRPRAGRWPCSRWAFRASAPTSTSCASCSRCSAPRWPSICT